MHLLLAALGSIVTILVLLNRLNSAGINLASLNPFLWHRRNKWHKKYNSDPIYSLEQPMDVVGLLVTAVVKVDGDISREEKAQVLSLFQTELKLSQEEAAQLFGSSVYLLNDGANIVNSVDKIMRPSLSRFTQAQADSAISMLTRAAQCDGTSTSVQQGIIDVVADIFAKQFAPQETWK